MGIGRFLVGIGCVAMRKMLRVGIIIIVVIVFFFWYEFWVFKSGNFFSCKMGRGEINDS